MLIKNFKNQSGKNRRKSMDYRAAVITERFLSMMLKVSSNPEFTKVKKLQNFQKFIQATPAEEYEKDPAVYALLIAIECVIKNKLEGATEIEDLVNYVNIELAESFEDIKENVIFPAILSGTESTDRETMLVTKTCDKFLRYEAVLTKKDDLADIITDIGSGNVGSLDSALNDLKEIIDILHDEFDKTESLDNELSIFHTSRPDEFREKFREAYEYENSPKMALHTGLKSFDAMLSTKGGFLGGTFALFMADTNTFKSALLENIKRWICVYNSDMFMEEFLRTHKRPTVVFISIENGSKEDLSRDYSIYTKTNMDTVDNFETAFDTWKQSYGGIIDVTQINAGDYPINLDKVKEIIKKVEQDGFFVISVIVDSFDLMAPDSEDIMRGITDETSLLLNRARAIEKWINDKPYPFITAHQLNRQAAMTISEKRQQGCVDLCKFLGREHVSGSYDILRRAHITIFVNTEYSKYDNEKYLELHRDKVRYRKNEDEDYLVTKLHDGFFIEDDQGLPFNSCRKSIMPLDIGTNLDIPKVMERGLSSIKGTIIQVPKKKDEDEKDKKPKPMFSSEDKNEEEDTPYCPYVPLPIFNMMPMYMEPVNKEFLGFSPFDIMDDRVKLTHTDCGTFIGRDDNFVSPYNI